MKNKDLIDNFNLAQRLFNNGQVSQAENIINNLVVKYPKIPEIHNFQGLIYLSTKRLNEALKSLSQALNLKKDFPIANSLMGVALAQLKKNKEAIFYLKQSIQLDENIIESYINLANVYLTEKKYLEAELIIKKARQKDKNNYQIFECLGNIYINLKNYEEAILSLKQAILIFPQSPIAHNNLAICYEKISLFDQAIKHYLKSINFSPKNQLTYLSLAKLYYQNNDLNSANLLLKNNFNKFSDQCLIESLKYLAMINSELNQLSEAKKYYEEYFKYNDNVSEFFKFLYNYSEIYPLNKNEYVIDLAKKIAEANELTDNSKAHFNFTLAAFYKSQNKMSEFIKSLTTANKHLKAHTNYSFLKYQNTFDLTEIVTKNLNQIKFNNFTENINPIFIVGMPRSGTTLLEQIISSHPEVYGAGEIYSLENDISSLNIIMRLSSKNITKKEIQDLTLIKNNYLNNIKRINKNKKFHTDKYPLNFLYLNIILMIFPNAKIIHIERTKKAVAWSLYERWMGEKYGFSSNFNDIKIFYEHYIKLMSFWYKKYPNKIFNINYEELTSNPEKIIPKLINFCDLPWNISCLSPHKNNRMINTPSKLQVRKKIYKDSSLKWNNFIEYFPDLNSF